MMRPAIPPLIALGVALLCTGRAEAQTTRSVDGAHRVTPLVKVSVDARLYRRPTPPIGRQPPATPLLPFRDTSDRRLVRGAIGAAIGAVAGLATCTLVANYLLYDERPGFKTCSPGGNVFFAFTGGALGFVIGWLTG